MKYIIENFYLLMLANNRTIYKKENKTEIKYSNSVLSAAS